MLAKCETHNILLQSLRQWL